MTSQNTCLEHVGWVALNHCYSIRAHTHKQTRTHTHSIFSSSLFVSHLKAYFLLVLVTDLIQCNTGKDRLSVVKFRNLNGGFIKLHTLTAIHSAKLSDFPFISTHRWHSSWRDWWKKCAPCPEKKCSELFQCYTYSTASVHMQSRGVSMQQHRGKKRNAIQTLFTLLLM